MTLYTETEDNLLIALKKAKLPYIEIAKQLPEHSIDSIRCRYYDLSKKLCLEKVKNSQEWYEGARIGFLDIETSSFDADTGMMLSWCVKMLDGELFEGVITKKELLSNKQDYKLVKSLVTLLRDKVDIIATYYGTGFDIPFLRSRCLELGIPFFSYGEKYHWDIYYWVKSLMKLHRNSLDSATTFLDIPGKNHVELKVWNLAKYGDKGSLDYVLNHNREDVKILESLYKRLEGFKIKNKKSL